MGEWTDKAKGKLKKIEGDLTNDPERRAQGEDDEVKGDLKGAGKKLGDAAEKVVDAFHKKTT